MALTPFYFGSNRAILIISKMETREMSSKIGFFFKTHELSTI